MRDLLKTFGHLNHKKSHMLMHQECKPYKCTLCEKNFSRKSQLRAHERKHQGIFPFSCQKCGKAYADKESCRKHTKKSDERGYCAPSAASQKPKNILKCRFCQKIFPNESHRIQHERIHSGEKPYKCTVCGKRFTQSSHLESHLRTHTKERPYTCELCELRFSTSSSRKRHSLRVHVKKENMSYVTKVKQ